ncbi:MAG: TlpA disulfide reductase family protein [bacterium]
MALPQRVLAQKAPAYARPVEYNARTLAGDSVRIGSGERLTLVDVFATWCTTCKTEFADLEALSHQFGDRGLRVVAVAVDEASADRVRRFVDARHTTFPVIHDSTGHVTRVFRTVGVPENYLVDADGRVVWHHGGEIALALTGLRRAIATQPVLGR